jgi:hypothetical protein
MKFDAVQRKVAEIIKDKVVVGHSLWNDLSGRFPWSRGIVFQESVAIALNRRFICYCFFSARDSAPCS